MKQLAHSHCIPAGTAAAATADDDDLVPYFSCIANFPYFLATFDFM